MTNELSLSAPEIAKKSSSLDPWSNTRSISATTERAMRYQPIVFYFSASWLAVGLLPFET
jgi:hypothetical protein